MYGVFTLAIITITSAKCGGFSGVFGYLEYLIRQATIQAFKDFR